MQVPLRDMIRELRRQLISALSDGKDQEVKFALGEIELELHVEVENTGGGQAGIQFYVVSLGGKGQRTSTRTQTIRLKLTPVLGTAQDATKTLVVGSDQVQRPVPQSIPDE